MILLVIGYVLMTISAVFNLNPNRPQIDWGALPWLLAYLIGMLVISFFGQFPGSGGVGIVDGVSILGVNFATTFVGGVGNAIPFYWDILVVAVFSLVIYYWAVAVRLPEAQVDKYVAEVYPPPID